MIDAVNAKLTTGEVQQAERARSRGPTHDPKGAGIAVVEGPGLGRSSVVRMERLAIRAATAKLAPRRASMRPCHGPRAAFPSSGGQVAAALLRGRAGRRHPPDRAAGCRRRDSGELVVVARNVLSGASTNRVATHSGAARRGSAGRRRLPGGLRVEPRGRVAARSRTRAAPPTSTAFEAWVAAGLPVVPAGSGTDRTAPRE